jgi:hypothetical protein
MQEWFVISNKIDSLTGTLLGIAKNVNCLSVLVNIVTYGGCVTENNVFRV